MKLSICIPTYNRAKHLRNCLHSIIGNEDRTTLDFEICVSDNCSTDETMEVVRAAQDSIPIRYSRNSANLGMVRNFVKVLEMAEGEFVWLIGDDDLLMPQALKKISQLLCQYADKDYFYVNSFHLTTEYVFSFPQPFDHGRLPPDMRPFSSWSKSGEMSFLELIDPKKSFDFLGGVFLSVFRREKWNANVHLINDEGTEANKLVFSKFSNTFPHVKVFASAFAKSQAYFCAEPLSVSLSGAREWAPMYPLVRSVRLVEAVEEYRKNGLPYLKYLRCRNFALRAFLPDFAYMFIKRKSSGYAYIRPFDLVLANFLYPNFYLSVFYFFMRRLKAIFIT